MAASGGGHGELESSWTRRGGRYPMKLQSHRELEATRAKLRLLEDRYEANLREQGGDENVRQLSARSLKRLINQLKEEIVRFESHASVAK